MVVVSATALRKNLFSYLDRAANGEVVVIKRNRCEVARLVSTQPVNWRKKMTVKPKIEVSEEEFVKPLEDVWEEYL